VFQWRSRANIIIAAPKTGVIKASIRITRNKVMLIKGIRTLLLRNPGMESVRRVIKRLVNDIVVLKPASKTLIIATSWAPLPVNLRFPEKGVMKVHPDIVKIEFEHLAITTFFLRSFTT